MSPFLNRLFLNNKIEVYLDDFDHQQKTYNDFIFRDYAQVIINHLTFYFYQNYFKSSSKVNLDRLTDSTPRVLIVGQRLEAMELDVKKNSLVDLVEDNLKEVIFFEKIIENLNKYELIICAQTYNTYGSHGLSQRLEKYLSDNLMTDSVKPINLVSLKSMGNYSSTYYRMFQERYSQKHISSISSNKNTPHFKFKSKPSGDTFFIPYGPFPENYDWETYGLK